MKHHVLIAILGASLVACGEGPAGDSGAPGPQGPAGPEGPQGPEGPAAVFVTGVVADAGGPVGVGLPVFLFAIDDTGDRTGELGGTFTEAGGLFSIEISEGVTPDARLILFASDGESFQAASLSTTGEVQVDPVSTGVLASVLLITETPGGRVLGDYTPAEMADLYAQGAAALAAAGTDLVDLDAVIGELIASIGGLIADYSEGEMTPRLGLELAAPPDVAVVGAGVETVLADIVGANYDIDDAGRVDDGNVAGQFDAFDDGFELFIDGAAFPLLSRVVEDGDEVVVGPAPLSGLQVTRKVRITQGLVGVRYTEILVNPTGADITVDVAVEQDSGADNSAQILNTSSGDLVLDTADEWVYIDDSSLTGSDPVTGFWFGDAITSMNVNPAPGVNGANITYRWDSVTVPAGGRITLIHFGFIAPDPPNTVAIEAGLDALPPLELEAYAGMTQADLDANITFSQGRAATIIGEAGSVASFAAVDVVNQTTGENVLIGAESDGSFLLPIGAVSGDSIVVTATDGTDQTLTIP